MWTLPQPTVDDASDDLTAALTLRDGTSVYPLSPQERAAVFAVYQAYDALGGQPGDGLVPPALSDATRTALETAYGQVQINGRLAALRDRLLLSVNVCPLCGFGEPRELDHYLPKSVYKALAIYARNLVPCCSGCNNAKRALDPAQGRRFIHPYFAALPAHTFLRATAQFADGKLTVTFAIASDGLDPALADALNHQLERLRLNDRYDRQVNTFLFGIASGLEDLLEDRFHAELRAFFTRSAARMAVRFGLNDWRPATLNALAGCDAFIQGGALVYFGQNPAYGG
ncbi:HNH endonuclease [Brevundimonas sp.]|uniref:HNH endonuclease n=1 Tax=Brevundimonas sp. TaxID=1871086 RepID=UPI00356A99AC